MSRNSYYRLLFVVAAIWNGIAALFSAFALPDPRLRAYLGIAAPADRLSIDLFVLLVVVFGIGYYWVSRDITANRDLVKLGAIGKLMVFPLFSVHAWLGGIPWRLTLPALGDLILGLLFVEFLLYTRRRREHPP